MPTPHRLYRSTTDRLIAGVAGGLAEYLQIDSTLVRIVFAALCFAGGLGILLYLMCWLLVPEEGGRSIVEEFASERQARSAAQEAPGADPAAKEDRAELHRRTRGSRSGGLWLVLIGVVFLLASFNYITFGDIGRLWPLILIVIGLQILGNGTKRN